MKGSSRIEAIDLARGWASLIMIQGHAFHAWTNPAAKATRAYGWTRLLGTLPLPAFLLLAGMSLLWRMRSAERKGEDLDHVRRLVCRRGLSVVAWGYALSLLSAWMDGYESLWQVLRADVLHVIGLSLALLGALGISARGGRNRLPKVAAWAALLTLMLCPVFSAWLRGRPAIYPWALLVRLFVEWGDPRQMPLIPLLAWCAIGVLLGEAMWRRRAREAGRDLDVLRIGVDRKALVCVLMLSLVGAALAEFGTKALRSYFGGPLTRAHPAVVFNAIELACRATILASVAALSAWILPQRLRSGLRRFGRHSLLAYALHIPLCYGRIAAPWRGKLTMLEAACGVVLLVSVCAALIVAREALPERNRGSDRSRSAEKTPPPRAR